MKRRFRSGYERMAYVTMEYVTRNKTQMQLAEELNLSHQRIHQIVKAGLIRANCPESAPAPEIGARLFAALMPRCHEPDTIEDFTRYELIFRGRYCPNPWS